MKRTLCSILAGAAIAGAIIACGGSSKKAAMTMPPGGAHPDAAVPTIGGHDQRIVDADAKIGDAMQKLGLEHRADVASTCAQPPCGGPGALQAMAVKPSTDPKCAHGTSQACTDICALADSICENSTTICKIAKELGNDAWANSKCAGAETSCDNARGKCCGCS